MKVDHEPALLNEAVELLNVKSGGKYIDATLGAGGHGEAILERGGVLLGIDQDLVAIEIAKQKLKIKDEKLKIVHGNFRDIGEIALSHGFDRVDGILFDLGMSSIQLESSGRGFSFMRDELLDMRMDPESQSVTAADLLNGLREDQLYELFNKTIPENLARRVAGATIRTRPINRTTELVDVVNHLVKRRGKIHPATTIFMALRLAVNSELENLEMGLFGALNILAPGGRLVIISFHSGEDRIVKNFLKDRQRDGFLKVLTKKPVIPTLAEIKNNPRSRSAKLRAGERIS